MKLVEYTTHIKKNIYKNNSDFFNILLNTDHMLSSLIKNSKIITFTSRRFFKIKKACLIGERK